MNAETLNSMAAADDRAQYDECAKRLVAQKMILAHILVRTVDEFKGMKPENIVDCIEGEPQLGTVPVNPGMTNERRKNETDITEEYIKGLNTEYSEINEGTVRFDIIFYVRMRDGLSQIIINIEIQKNKPRKYKLLNRAIFYVSRMVSSQKGRDFVKSNYDDMKRVFNIWICMNMKENSLDRYFLENEKELGHCQWEGKQDLLNIIFIGLTRKLPEQDEKYELHRLLGTLLSDEMAVQEKAEIIEKEYHIPMSDGMRRDVNEMCNLGEGIEERVTEQFIISMYEKKFTVEQIADVVHKSVDEIEEIIADNSLVSV